MSFLTNLENSISSFFSESEAFVLKLVTDIQQGVQVVETDLTAAFAWVNSHAGDITSAVTTIEGVVSSLTTAGVGVPAAVLTAVKDANIAVSALNAYVSSSNAGAGTPQALVNGYIAAKNASIAASSASIAVATNPNGAPAVPPITAPAA